MPAVDLIELPAPRMERMISRLRRHIDSLLERCAKLSGFKDPVAETQPITVLPAQVSAGENEIVIRMITLAPTRNLYVSADGRSLVIEGRVNEHVEHACGKVHMREVVQRRFSRSFEFPWMIDTRGVTAEIEGCVLTMRIRREEKTLADSLPSFLSSLGPGAQETIYPV